MATSAALTGQDAVLAAIKAWAEDKSGPVSMTLVGASGTGKSWVIRELAAALRAERLVLIAEGDPFNGNRQLLPLAIALSQSPRFKRMAKTAASEAGRGVPYAGGLLQFTLNMLLNYREIAQASQTPFLPHAERELLIEIQHRAEARDVLIVLENLHWWDEQSFDLLALILTKKLDNVFPFLTRTKFLAVLTPEQNPTHPDKLARIRQLLSGQTIELRHCQEAVFAELLRSLGATKLPDAETVAALYRASRGHLAMAQRLAQRLNAPHPSAPNQARASDIDALCRELLEERITALGERGVRMSALLRQAAAIGLSFTDNEVRCLAKDLAPDISTCLADARALELLAADSDRLVFSHEIIQRYFSHIASERDSDVHRRFAECLKLLRPGDYRARAHHHTLAGQDELAALARAHHALAERRSGAVSATTGASDAGLPGVFGRFVQTLCEAWEHYDAGRYGAALDAGRRIDDTLPSSLLAERDSLMARCHINGLTKDHWHSARRVLQRWNKLVETELDVWGRIMLIQIVAMLYDSDVEGAKAAAHELSTKLSPRQSFDREAVRTLARLKLKSDMLYVPEVAGAMIAEALETFGPRARQPEVNDPINYFIGLTNLAANQILNGRFADAFGAAQDGERFLAELHAREQRLLFPRVDMLANNLVIAGYRAGILTTSAAAATLGHAVASAAPTTDTPLLKGNHAALVAMEGRPEEALATLLELKKIVSSAVDYDAYYAYFVLNNLAGVHYALGDADAARHTWDQAGAALSRIELPIRSYFDRRHALQSSCFDAPAPASVARWEGHIRSAGHAAEVGPGWQHFGRGFLLSDLQYWAED